MPLAARLGLTMKTSYGAGDEKKLVEQVITRPGPTLISWQHGGIPAIAKAFRRRRRSRRRTGRTTGSTSCGPAPGPRRWRFAQVPELVLPGDQDTVLKN